MRHAPQTPKRHRRRVVDLCISVEPRARFMTSWAQRRLSSIMAGSESKVHGRLGCSATPKHAWHTQHAAPGRSLALSPNLPCTSPHHAAPPSKISFSLGPQTQRSRRLRFEPMHSCGRPWPERRHGSLPCARAPHVLGWRVFHVSTPCIHPYAIRASTPGCSLPLPRVLDAPRICQTQTPSGAVAIAKAVTRCRLVPCVPQGTAASLAHALRHPRLAAPWQRWQVHPPHALGGASPDRRTWREQRLRHALRDRVVGDRRTRRWSCLVFAATSATTVGTPYTLGGGIKQSEPLPPVPLLEGRLLRALVPLRQHGTS